MGAITMQAKSALFERIPQTIVVKTLLKIYSLLI